MSLLKAGGYWPDKSRLSELVKAMWCHQPEESGQRHPANAVPASRCIALPVGWIRHPLLARTNDHASSNQREETLNRFNQPSDQH